MRTMTHRDESPAVAEGRAVRLVATILAGVFVLVGIAGFIPGLTTNVDEIEFAGHARAEHTELLGIFHVSVLHNLVHLAFGAGLFLARSAAGAVTFLVGGGIVYALVLVYGVVIDLDSDWNFIPVDRADNWLHAGLAVGMIALGVALSPRARSTTDQVG